MHISKTQYQPWGNVMAIANGNVKLLVTLDIGPRIIYLARKAGEGYGENIMHEDVDEQTTVFNEYFEQNGLTEPWRIYGGHRLWKSPEEWMSYYPDSNPVVYSIEKIDGLEYAVFTAPVEVTSQLQKSICIHVSEYGIVTVRHRVRATGECMSMAMWGLTVLKGGGTLYCPLNERTEGFNPVRNYTLWCGARLDDPRFCVKEDVFTLTYSDEATLHPFKIGSFVKKGVVAYARGRDLFIKRFGAKDNVVYPDSGCNFETYTNHLFMECESLSPILRVDGSPVEHIETWQLVENTQETLESVLG